MKKSPRNGALFFNKETNPFLASLPTLISFNSLFCIFGIRGEVMDLMDDAVKVLSVKGLHFFAFVGGYDFRKPIGRDKLNLAFDVFETAHEAILVDEDDADKVIDLESAYQGKPIDDVLGFDERRRDFLLEGVFAVFQIIDPIEVLGCRVDGPFEITVHDDIKEFVPT